jgi:ABC-type lipoprotein export system ATPase subunit
VCIAIDHTSIRFGRLEVTADVSLEVPSGDFVTIVGPSGCGKSTLLNAVAGLLEDPASEVKGAISIDGARPGTGSRLGYVFQRDTLLPWATLLANVQVGMIIRGIHKAERLRRARELMKTVGLDGFEGYYPHQVSGGMRQRAQLIRSLAYEPEAVLSLFAFVHDPIARLAGSPWKAVVSTYDREIFSLLVRSALKDQVKTVADLKGKNVGVTGPGSGSWAIANVYLKRAGLTPDKDVSLVNLGGDTAVIYTALQSGKVDAISSWEPITSRVIETGAGFPLVPIWEAAQHKEWVGSDHALGFALMTREDVIQSKADLVKRMVAAHKKALELIKASSADTLAGVILGNPKAAEQFQGLDRATVVKLIDRIKTGYGTGCLSKSGFDVEVNLAVTYQLVKQPITFNEFADTQFAGECS